ncbi:MAG: biopolymer transporter ExbD [Gemmobacter sp.]|nr:biopolymer transporter ExbD [Gemmobacter sp.]
MDFSDPPRHPRQENLLPMINVVFLLLVFFLIAARMTPPEPFDVTPPQARADSEARGDFTLFLAADGRLGYRDMSQDAALTALGAARQAYCAGADCVGQPPRLTLRGDTALPAVHLATLLPRLSGLGFAQIELVVQAGPTG